MVLSVCPRFITAADPIWKDCDWTWRPAAHTISRNSEFGGGEQIVP